MGLEDNIKGDFDPQFVAFCQNLMPKIMEAEDQLFSEDPDLPDDPIQAMKYRFQKVSESGIFEKFGAEKPISAEDANKFTIEDDVVVSFDGKEIPIKIYRPTGHEGEKLQVHFNFHGGGFVIGGLYTDKTLVSQLCLDTGCVIIDVDYRMCPEFAFPYPLFDSYSAIKYVYENHQKYNIKPEGFSCGGISAGGQISLGLAHLCRDNNIPLKLVLSNVPPADCFIGVKNAMDTRFNGSVLRYEFAIPPQWKDTVRFEDIRASANKTGKTVNYDDIIYKELDIRNNPHIVGYYVDLFTVRNFRNLPRHVISTGGVDHLRDGGKEYAKVLVDREVDVRYYCASGCPHSFVGLRNVLDKAKYYYNIMVKEINDLSI